ncbi:MAG TPA: hypothetical protein VL493_01840 [Candidatus Saccharimonadales bacterium]|jgi:hypothetical protein|nr:hypothetical protein [Candidatus Saccharimonadales bacterium]
MPTEEGKQVLKLLAEGKIDAEQAYRLLKAIGDVDESGAHQSHPPHPPGAERPLFPPDAPIPPGLGRRTLRIMVTSGGKSKVNIAIPLGIARMGKTKIAASGLVREQLAKFGIDLDDVLRHISHSGPIVDISDGDDRVLIVVE